MDRVGRHGNPAETSTWILKESIQAIGQMSMSFSRMSIP